jgi:hypothetical protein
MIDLESGVVPVVLLPARQFRCPLAHIAAGISDLFPSLPSFLDSVIDAWLDSPTPAFTSRMGCHLAYLYDYADELQDPQFANLLLPQHRQFHVRYLKQKIKESERPQQRQLRDSVLQAIPQQKPHITHGLLPRISLLSGHRANGRH